MLRIMNYNYSLGQSVQIAVGQEARNQAYCYYYLLSPSFSYLLVLVCFLPCSCVSGIQWWWFVVACFLLLLLATFWYWPVFTEVGPIYYFILLKQRSLVYPPDYYYYYYYYYLNYCDLYYLCYYFGFIIIIIDVIPQDENKNYGQHCSGMAIVFIDVVLSARSALKSHFEVSQGRVVLFPVVLFSRWNTHGTLL